MEMVDEEFCSALVGIALLVLLPNIIPDSEVEEPVLSNLIDT